jgi:hypothetical protein
MRYAYLYILVQKWLSPTMWCYVLWYIGINVLEETPCHLYCQGLTGSTLQMETVGPSKMLLPAYKIANCDILDNSNLHSHCHENLES